MSNVLRELLFDTVELIVRVLVLIHIDQAVLTGDTLVETQKGVLSLPFWECVLVAHIISLLIVDLNEIVLWLVLLSTRVGSLDLFLVRLFDLIEFFDKSHTVSLEFIGCLHCIQKHFVKEA